jgi:Mrp family chromosome partitioning ATPase
LLEDSDASAVLVSSADAVALQDTLKASRFCTERGLPIIGLVENYAGTVCPHCGGEIKLFPRAPEIAAFEAAGVETQARLPFATMIAAGAAAGRPAAGLPDSPVTEWLAPLVTACTDRLRSQPKADIRGVGRPQC